MSSAISRVLVGTDGSDTAAKAVARAVDVAQAAGATLTILCAASAAKGNKVVAAAAATHASSGVTIDTLVVDDDAAKAIIDTARTGGYDLIVTGNKGMTGITRFLRVGAVPNKLAHHLPCSFLIVRTT